MGPIERELWSFWELIQEVDLRHGDVPYMSAPRVVFGRLRSEAAGGVMSAAHSLSADDPARFTSDLFWNDAYSEAIEAAEALGL